LSAKEKEKKSKEKKKKIKGKRSDVASELPQVENKKVAETLNLLDSIDEERWEESKKEKEKFEEILKKEQQTHSETIQKEKMEKAKDKLSWSEFKKELDVLKVRKQELYVKENYEEAIKVSKQIIELSKKADMKITIQQEERSLALMLDAVEKSTQKSIILDKIEGLKNIKQGFYVKGEYEDAIRIAKKIIELAKKINMTQIESEQVNSINLMKEKVEKKSSKMDIVGTLEGLEAVKLGYFINEDFRNAIKVSKKILEMAKKSNFKEVVLEQEKFIDFISSKIEEKTSKIEIIEKIEGLKNIKQAHVVKAEFEKAINVSQKIKKFATIANIPSLVQEEEKSIKEMQQKIDNKEKFSKIQEECQKLDEMFDMFVEDGEIIEAHELIEEFKKKYSNIVYFFFTSIPGVEELIEKDRKTWLRYKVKKDYIETEKEEYIDKIVEEEKPKPKLDKIQSIKAGIAPKQELNRLKLDRAQLEEEKSRLRLKTLKFEKDEEKFEIEKKKIELEKVELEEKESRLNLGKLKFQKEKEKHDKEKLEIEKKLEAEMALLKEELMKFEEEKEKFYRMKEDMMERDNKVKLEIASLNEERAALKLEKVKIERLKTKFELQKKEINEEKPK